MPGIRSAVLRTSDQQQPGTRGNNWLGEPAGVPAAGRMTHYRSTSRPLPPPTEITTSSGTADTADGQIHAVLRYERQETPAQEQARRQAAAESWIAVWVSDYTIDVDPATRALAAWLGDTTPLRIRPVVSPATGATLGG